MSAASSIGLFLCPMDLNQRVSNSTLVLITTNRSYDTESKLNLLLGIIQPNENTNVDSKPNNISKLQQFMPNEFNNIRAEILDKNANKTSPKNEEKLFLLQDNNDTQSDFSHYPNEHRQPCSHPEYLVFTWVLCLIALATGLKLYYLVKTFMASIMVLCYAILISIVFPQVFENASTESEDNSKYGMPLTARMNILLIVFLTMVTYHARLVEVTSRLDFIWKEQAENMLSNMRNNRVLNDLLIKANIYFSFTSYNYVYIIIFPL